MQDNGYDERFFKLMLAEYVRRNFPEDERRQFPDVRVQICTPYDWNDPVSDYYENRSIIVIPGSPPPRPHSPRIPDADAPPAARPASAPPAAPAPTATKDESADEDSDAEGDDICWVWACKTLLGNFDIGWLVTETGDFNRPVAFVESDGERRDADLLKLAWRIADDRLLAGRVACIDLRDKGRPESISEMPGFIYALECNRINRAGELLDEGGTPVPFCKFRLKRMQEQAR